MTSILLGGEYWLIAGLVLGAVEIFAPGFFFLGFAGGAAVTALFVWLFGGAFEGSAHGWAWPVLVFALFSLATTFALRRLFGTRGARSRRFDDVDVNDTPYRGDKS
ncbi:NfeD family protein [Marinibaculum pumilum]|uniref:NfeD family protein n=1 Tax=Marinibaculum pumilum TaxID=1766165 RepID=A0ABV7L8S6_9PROT